MCTVKKLKLYYTKYNNNNIYINNANNNHNRHQYLKKIHRENGETVPSSF